MMKFQQPVVDACNDVITRDDALLFQEKIQTMIRSLHHARSRIDNLLYEQFTHTECNALASLLDSCKENSKKHDCIEKKCREIITYVKALPCFIIMVAKLPTQSAILRYSSLLSERHGSKVLLDIIVDSEIVAGARIGFDGHIYDYSIASALEDYAKKL